jgi:hypothetical protein
MIRSTEPDKGKTWYFYDLTGRLKIVINAKDFEKKKWLINKYDGFGRLVAVCKRDMIWSIVSTSGVADTLFYIQEEGSNITAQELANRKEWPVVNTLGATADDGLLVSYIYEAFGESEYSILAGANAVNSSEGIPASVLNNIKNQGNKLAADIIYRQGTGRPRVINIYSYDNDGRMEMKIQNIVGYAPTINRYEYNVAGQLTKELFFTAGQNGYYHDRASVLEESRAVTVNNYFYDALGRIDKVVDKNEIVLAKYSYNARGQIIKSEIAYKDGVPTLITEYAYNIHGWLTSINGKRIGGDLFTQKLGYYSAGNSDDDAEFRAPSSLVAQYNGNISWQNVGYPFAIDKTKQNTKNVGYSYRYDDFNRLLEAKGAYYASAWTVDESFDETGLTYYPDGEIKTLKRGGVLDYEYYTNTHKLRSITGKAKGWESEFANTSAIAGVYRGKSLPNNYSYDEIGNVTGDLSKAMTIEYDWRNLPTLFRFANGDDVEMLYDAKGNRVAKIKKSKK